MMSQNRLMKVLLAPVVSEKSTMMAEKHGQVAFMSSLTLRSKKLRLQSNCSSRCKSKAFKWSTSRVRRLVSVVSLVSTAMFARLM